MTTQQLNLLAVISIVACWGSVALAWLAGAIYYQSREPPERTRASYLSPILITTVIIGRLVRGRRPGQTGFP